MGQAWWVRAKGRCCVEKLQRAQASSTLSTMHRCVLSASMVDGARQDWDSESGRPLSRVEGEMDRGRKENERKRGEERGREKEGEGEGEAGRGG